PFSTRMMRRLVSSLSVAASTPPAAPDPTMRMSQSRRIRRSRSSARQQWSVVSDGGPHGLHRVRGNHDQGPRRRIELLFEEKRAASPQVEVGPLLFQPKRAETGRAI